MSSIGVAAGVIMTTIITDHIANVKNTSVARHGASMIMPIPPIAADAVDDDVIVRCR